MREMQWNEINSMEMMRRIQNPTETTPKCQWVIQECAHDGNSSVQTIMSADRRSQICHVNENLKDVWLGSG